MSFTSASYGSAPSQYSSHSQTSLGNQQPQLRSRNYQDTQRPNFGDTRSADPRRSVTLPIPDALLASHSRVPRDSDQNVDPSYPRLFFTPAGSYDQPPDLGVSGTTMYPSEGPLPHAGSTRDAIAARRHAYPPPCTCIVHPTTVPSAGPSRLGDEQPVIFWRHDSTAPPGLVMAAPVPAPACTASINLIASAALQYTSSPAVPAQALSNSNTDVIGWPHVAEGDKTSTRVPSARPLLSPPRLRPVPLVRVEDRVAWVRPHVLKVTLWLNWSPNADAEAHQPWGVMGEAMLVRRAAGFSGKRPGLN
ncbi:hypothetical protein BJY52DRAFT_1221140 [Lactarius psammicola]|nr:hypothetical protein BJY52DRAFT_1221140 [Lactarius psammicola]